MSNPTWILQSPLSTLSGYGNWSLELAKSLVRYSKTHPIDLKFVLTAWGSCSQRDMQRELNDPDVKEIVNRIMREPLTRQPEVFMQCTIPMEYVQPAKYNIGFTAFIETTICRPEWLEKMNAMNLNVVLSKFNVDVATAANYNKKNPNGVSELLKLNKPIVPLFWGVNTSVFFKTNEKLETVEECFNNIPEDFCFLFVGQWTSGNMNSDRKNIGFLIKTFLETFANTDNPPALVLKTNGAQICIMDKYDCLNKINEVTNMVKGVLPAGSKLPNVYLLHGELENKEMNALYNHDKVKIHVSFTHGEGFGSPLLEATLSGKPVLAPAWSGHLDFLNPKYCKYFDGALATIPPEAKNEWFVESAQWYSVEYIAAGHRMKYYFNNYYKDTTILENAEALRLENMEKFSTQAMDKVFHALLDNYIPKFIQESPIILPKLKKINLPSLKLPPTNVSESLSK